MTDDLLASLGIYGGSLVMAFVAGLFPLASIELFLIGVATVVSPPIEAMLLCCVVAAISHQIAKTLTYFAGVGALEHGKLKQKLEAARPRIELWNKAPHLMLALAGAFGIPPLWILGFIAKPLMQIRFWAFTAIVFATRLGRFVALAVTPLLV